MNVRVPHSYPSPVTVRAPRSPISERVTQTERMLTRDNSQLRYKRTNYRSQTIPTSVPRQSYSWTTTSSATLIQRAYYRLASTDRTAFEPTESVFNTLESAFLWAYLGTIRESEALGHVTAAINDARAVTAKEFEGREADLRAELPPAFYQYLAAFHCAYRG